MSQPAPAQPAEFAPGEIAADSVRLAEEQRSGRGVLGSAVVVSGATMVSRVSGLARDVLMALLIGIGPATDAFMIAFTIPNLFRKLFGEGALSSAMIPVLSRYRLRGDMAATRRLLGTTATLLTLGLGAVCVVSLAMVWALPADWFHDPAKFADFREYLTILLPYVVFICLSALQAGALNTWNRFGVPALMPAVANLIVVAVLIGLLLSPLRGNIHTAVLVMCGGVLVSGAAQWLLQMPQMRRAGLLSPPRLALREPGLRETFKAMAPMLFALAVFQVNTFLDQVLAEMLVPGDGAVSSYGYASRLFQFPLGLVGVAMGTAMFPLMARFAASGDHARLKASLLNSVRLIAFVALPAAAGLAVLAWPITRLLFAGPNSTPEMLDRSALVLAMLCLSLPIVSVLSLLTRAFYALKDHRTPTRLALVAVAVNLGANLILLQTPLLEAGLALGTAISSAVNLSLMAWLLRKRLRAAVPSAPVASSDQLAQPLSAAEARRIPLDIARAVAVSLAMAACAWGVEAAVRGVIAGRSGLALSVTAGVLAGIAVYALLSLALRAPESRQFLALRR